jgi:cytoskeletal protein CcmA (bactofilin family)
MADPAAPRTVQCYHCRQWFDVPARAMSISCPWCYRRVGLDDLVIKGACWTSKIQTCGRVVVKARATLVAPLIEASQGVEVHGTIEGAIVSGAQLYVGPRARVKGQIRAPSIKVEPGGVLEGAFVQIALARPRAKDKPGAPTRQARDVVLKPVVRLPEWLRLRPA